ncbi:MAG: phage tail tape measure protein, partial [Pseudomonas sagittaria]|nr:phage tail tape measure protein [Pseudomonas sagittaria]
MTGPNKVEIALSVDKREGESNLKAFSRAFDQLLRSLGKSDGDIKAFRRLAADVEAGKVAVASLDEQTRKLLQVFREGSQVAADRDLLGLSAHKDIQEQIYRTREAYERLAASGKLTSAELAQAALKTEERIRELHKETNGWADSLVNAKAALAGMAASAAGVTAVAVAGIKFESSMAAVNKVVGGTDEQIAALSKRLRELATEMPVEGGVNGLAAIAAMGGQLGVPIEKLEAFVTLAAKMGVAFNLSSEQSAKAVAELSNVFNLPLERVGELGDAVNALGNTMSAREGDIVDVLTRIGGSATQFNLTAEQSAALAASMLSLGMSSEVAGTGINAMLAKLQTAKLQGADFQAALAEMGVSANKLAKDIRANPQAALLEFLRTLKSLDGQSRAEVITRLFGLEYQDKISRLVAGLAQYEAALGRISSRSATAGAMEKEYQAQLKTTDAQIRLLRQSVEVAAINLGTVFLPALRSVVTMLGDAAAGVAKFIETFPEISALAATLGTVMVTAGSLRLVLLALTVAGTRGFGALFGAVKDLNVGLGDAIKNVGKLQTAFNLAGAAIVGWEIGRWAREEFEIVELAGVELANALTKLAERAQFAWFAYENKWSPKTVIDEYDRLQQRLKEIDDTYAEMAAEAKARRAGQSMSAPPAPPLPAANLDKPATGAENLAGSLAKAREAAAELGVDLTKFSTSVSPEFEVLQTHLDALVAALPKLKESGVQTGAALKTALSQMIAGARNPAELLALTERIRELGAAGELSKPQLVSLFDDVRKKAREATAETAQLRGEIANLLAEASNVRNGTAGAGAKATERRERGLTD